METLEQYNERVGKRVESFHASSNAIQHTAELKARLLKEFKEMFDLNTLVPVDSDEAQEILDSSAMKGLYRDCLNSLNEAFTVWVEANPDTPVSRFLVPLTGEGTAFGSKNPDTVYQGFTTALKRDEFKGEWRIIKRTKDEVVTILICKL